MAFPVSKALLSPLPFLLLITGCASVRSPDAAVQSSVMTGREFKARLGEIATASAAVPVATAYVAYVGSDASYHHFTQKDGQGGNQQIFRVPRGDIQFGREYPYGQGNLVIGNGIPFALDDRGNVFFADRQYPPRFAPHNEFAVAGAGLKLGKEAPYGQEDRLIVNGHPIDLGNRDKVQFMDRQNPLLPEPINAPTVVNPLQDNIKVGAFGIVGGEPIPGPLSQPNPAPKARLAVDREASQQPAP